MNDKKEKRENIINSISSWLKLLGLIVLAVESVLITGISLSSENDPLKGWYIPLMLVFFSLIVVGLFFDRYIQFKSFEKVEEHKSNFRGNTIGDFKQEFSELEYNQILQQFGGKTLRLSDNIAIVSEKLREESFIKIIKFLIHKIDVHSFVFLYPNPSSIIPINNKYFGRFSWDIETITCHELFEIPYDTDMEHWNKWTKMQHIYIHLYASEHRLPGSEPNEQKLKYFITRLHDIIKLAKLITEQNVEKSYVDSKILISRVLSIIDNIDLHDRSKSSKNTIVQLELALSTIHDVIKRLMPRVISV